MLGLADSKGGPALQQAHETVLALAAEVVRDGVLNEFADRSSLTSGGQFELLVDFFFDLGAYFDFAHGGDRLIAIEENPRDEGLHEGKAAVLVELSAATALGAGFEAATQEGKAAIRYEL